jgi:Trk K+ transport system NAD-binding subunit
MADLFDVRRLRWSALTRRQRVLAVFAAAIVVIVLSFTLVYHWGITTLEGRSRTVFQSLQTVIETMTTTGFGADAPWETPWMNLLVVTIQATGVIMGFVTLRVLVIPLFERTPLDLDDRLTKKRDHVVVAEYQRDTKVLLDELEALGVDYVLIDSEEDEAKRLSDDGYQAINGDPERREDLDRATIERAELLITDAGDRTASVVLTALEANEELRVVSFTASHRRRAALREVGVDRSVAPHALIGRRLAEKASTTVATTASGDGDVAIREILIRRESALRGVPVGQSPFATHADLTVVAGWFDGDLLLPPDPELRLRSNTVLLVAGPGDAIDAASSGGVGVRDPRGGSDGRVVVAGLGEGGREAVAALPDDAEVTTVDVDPATEPDVVGDVTEPETLEDAGVEEASALVLTVDDDSTALLAVAMARSLADDVEILVRVTDTEKTHPAFRAGADYVLSVQRVCARLVAAEVRGARVMDPASQIRMVRTSGAAFAERTLGELRRGTDEEWIVVAAVRDGAVHTDATTAIEADDDVVVAGSDVGIQAFERRFGD